MTDINSLSTADNYSGDLNPNTNYSWDFGTNGNNPLPGPTNIGGSMHPTEQHSDGGNNITTPSPDGSDLNDITTPAPERPFPGPQTEGTSVTPQGWFLTPAGNQVGLGDRPT